MTPQQLHALLEYYFKYPGTLQHEFPTKHSAGILGMMFFDNGGNYHSIEINRDGKLLTYEV